MGDSRGAKVTVTDSWARIERWLSSNAPEVVPLLPPGAAAPAFAEAAETLGYPLPVEVAEFLALHNGSAQLWLHDQGEFMALEGMLSA
jgi:cell wall assembly regulator SMI1